MFESVYEDLLYYELAGKCSLVERQKEVPLVHKGLIIQNAFRADLIIEGTVLIELKSVQVLADVHFKQVYTYLKLTGIRLGLLINFNESLLKNGYHRIANGL